MQDENLMDLCKTIYRRHRQAIDLIVEYGMVSNFEQVANETLAKEGGYEILRSGSNMVWFIPDSWARLVPENATTWGGLKRPVSVACWFVKRSEKLRLIFEVCRMKDSGLRMACVTGLQDAGFKLTKLAFKEDAKYSRFFNSNQRISDFSDEEEVRKAVAKLLARAKEQFPKAEAVFKKVFS